MPRMKLELPEILSLALAFAVLIALATDPRSQTRSRHRRIETTSVEGGRGHAVGLYVPP
jgi:hypothetical protein